LEQALRAVPQAQAIRSTTARGSTDLSLVFGWSADMVSALLQVHAATNQDLPISTLYEPERLDAIDYCGPVELGFAFFDGK
jgi:multidrug efflux pump subunit AcrB